MNVLLISQCDKRALTETRRILDQFAERKGERTWQTPITQAGLDTLRKLLRRTARKNTAVACHWIRGLDHSELLWIVGDARRFNAEGAVPTNTTVRNVLRREDENDWHSAEDIRLLAQLAALLHDLGKASVAFQRRLEGTLTERNRYRHEWVSLRMFQAFVGDDDDAGWLRRLAEPSAADPGRWDPARSGLRDGLDPEAAIRLPLAGLPPLARAIGWLILSHHRLPVMPGHDRSGHPRLGARIEGLRTDRLHDPLASIACDWNETPGDRDEDAVRPYWTFAGPLPVETERWRARAARVARRLLDRLDRDGRRSPIDDPFVMHLARMSLMLADHHYSRLTDTHQREAGARDYPLFANTFRDSGACCQALDEHLIGVAKHSGVVVHGLPGLERHLPRLARHRRLRQRSEDPRFRWQDRASDTAAAMRERAACNGAFIVNLASTGCGKTLGNARIMNALADPQAGMRCAFAMGLRTLTLQTGRAFQRLLRLGDDELAIMVGGAANRDLFAHHERLAERAGSASSQDLLPEDGHVLYEGNEDHPVLQRLGADAQVRRLIAAPILVCTIDHLVPATESQRGGRQIAPMLRLLSSDLVLDEPDDFDLEDLPALTRLVHWAGLLGSRVLLSSATLPPALVEGLFLAYRSGRTWFQRNRGERPDAPAAICCAWFDEFAQAQHDCESAEDFRERHLAFATRRHQMLGQQAETSASRRAALLPLPLQGERTEQLRDEFALRARDGALALHAEHHARDPRSGKRVSFGLIRMANIEPMIDVALALFRHGVPPGARIHLCVYHSRFPLLVRSDIERRLDAALDRRRPEAVFDLTDVRRCLDAYPEADHLFVVLGSPVTEVGRDHDYDWALVEPSSMRSLIQLAGRVRRHRPGAVERANIQVLQRNLRSFERPGKAAFCKPGFEQDSGAFRLVHHDLAHLLDPADYAVPDSRPRLLSAAPSDLRPQARLIDLEHARLRAQMLPPPPSPEPTPRQRRYGIAPEPAPLNASACWTHAHAALTAILQVQQRFRDDGHRREVELVLLPDESEEDYVLHRIDDAERPGKQVYVPLRDGVDLHRISDERLRGAGIGIWGVTDYMQVLRDYAAELDVPLEPCAKRYGKASVPDSTYGWWFHPALGYTRHA
ncbi:type I-F CRISPR-associated helicase Cas3f [Luteimonas huabeiensis]|uniref:type I-F CRISPR-associated helicase Cas3f n=1 Tax=Luteimonas huabeiensis TaxID=1244513 RepID=UPI0004656D02|nr:type I-F CRISPR-associated helicase Cas3f [Luteimonas huabeiensis]